MFEDILLAASVGSYEIQVSNFLTLPIAAKCLEIVASDSASL